MPIQFHKLSGGTLPTVTLSTTSSSIESLIKAQDADFDSRGIDYVAFSPSASVKYYADGNTPTTTEGLTASSGVVTEVSGQSLDKVLLCATSGTPTCVLQVGKNS